MDDRLYRSRGDRIIAGVAGGVADRWGADPSIIRLVWALLVILTGGIALLVYVIMAFVVPEEPIGYMARGVAPMPGAAPGSTPPSPSWSATSAYGTVPSRAERRAMRRAARSGRRGGETAAVVGGLILILLGSLFLLREWFPRIDFDWFWPMILIAIGVAVVVGALDRRPEAAASAHGVAPWQPAAPDAPATPDASSADATGSRPL